MSSPPKVFRSSLTRPDNDFTAPYRKRPLQSRPQPKFAHSPGPFYDSRSHAKITFDDKIDPNSKYVSHDYSAFMKDATCVEYESDVNESDHDMEDSTFHWEEEETLFSELMDDGTHQTDDDRLDELIDSLQDSFTEKGTQTKKQIAETLVGTHKHIRSMISLMDENVDPYYGNGINLVKKGSTGIEGTCYAREIEIKQTYEATQRKIQVIFDELKAEFAFRDKLWTKLEASINEIANPVLESVKDTPAQIERTIAKLEKQLEIDSSNTKAQNSTQKILQELLKGS